MKYRCSLVPAKFPLIQLSVSVPQEFLYRGANLVHGPNFHPKTSHTGLQNHGGLTESQTKESNVFKYMYLYIYIFTFIHIDVYICVCIYIYMYTNNYIKWLENFESTYIYIYTHRDVCTHTHRFYS